LLLRGRVGCSERAVRHRLRSTRPLAPRWGWPLHGRGFRSARGNTGHHCHQVVPQGLVAGREARTRFGMGLADRMGKLLRNSPALGLVCVAISRWATHARAGARLPARAPVCQAIIDAAATAAGRRPSQIRHPYNVVGSIGGRSAGQGLNGPVELWVERLRGRLTSASTASSSGRRIRQSSRFAYLQRRSFPACWKTSMPRARAPRERFDPNYVAVLSSSPCLIRAWPSSVQALLERCAPHSSHRLLG
jgi:hypothetical protein